MENFNNFFQLFFNRRMLKVDNVTFAVKDHFIWILLIPRAALLAFVLELLATVTAQVIVELRYILCVFLVTGIYPIKKLSDFFQKDKLYFTES